MRALGKPLTVLATIAMAALFEVAFAFWLGLAFVLEARGTRGISEDDLEGAGFIYFASWLLVGVSFVAALVGAVLAEGIRTRQTRWAREVVALLAGLLFGAGGVIVIGVGVVLSRLANDAVVVGAILFWPYLLLGPLFAFVASRASCCLV